MDHTSKYLGRAEPFDGVADRPAVAVTRDLARTVREHPIAAGLGALSAVSAAFAAIKAGRAGHRLSMLGVLALGVLAWRAALGWRHRGDDRPARLAPIFPAPVFTPPRP